MVGQGTTAACSWRPLEGDVAAQLFTAIDRSSEPEGQQPVDIMGDTRYKDLGMLIVPDRLSNLLDRPTIAAMREW